MKKILFILSLFVSLAFTGIVPSHAAVRNQLVIVHATNGNSVIFCQYDSDYGILTLPDLAQYESGSLQSDSFADYYATDTWICEYHVGADAFYVAIPSNREPGIGVELFLPDLSDIAANPVLLYPFYNIVPFEPDDVVGSPSLSDHLRLYSSLTAGTSGLYFSTDDRPLLASEAPLPYFASDYYFDYLGFFSGDSVPMGGPVSELYGGDYIPVWLIRSHILPDPTLTPDPTPTPDPAPTPDDSLILEDPLESRPYFQNLFEQILNFMLLNAVWSWLWEPFMIIIVLCIFKKLLEV